jgi:hypothetical protein
MNAARFAKALLRKLWPRSLAKKKAADSQEPAAFF